MKAFVAPEIEAYLFEHTQSPAPIFEEMRQRTYADMARPHMQVGRVEGALLRILTAAAGARRVLEIGTFTGFSALCMAESLPDDGELLTCDIDPHATALARQFFDMSPHGRKIKILLGDALETIARLSAPFDLVFLDADKSRYPAYFDAALPLLRKGGLFVADNTLWSGEVLHPLTDDARGIAAFNAKVTEDSRVDNVLLPVRDGIMLVQKR
ncbi:MAG: class I SAM-dependent methyltransferase [Polyangiaceae bacterium]|nr:class I SAM-dependent methyltransferase [Polyangiaceae bacterium]